MGPVDVYGKSVGRVGPVDVYGKWLSNKTMGSFSAKFDMGQAGGAVQYVAFPAEGPDSRVARSKLKGHKYACKN